MNNISSIINLIPKMLTGNELKKAMTYLPEYNNNIRKENEAIRLMSLSDLYKIYVPSNMSLEIYSKLYLALLRSLQKKTTLDAIIQQNENHKAILQQEYNGILGGSDSFTIIGPSGIGKSSAINKSIKLITENKIIELDKPYTKIIPCIIVQCPFDASVKGLLLEILRKVDEYINSTYYKNAVKARATIDMLIGSVSQVALNHIGLIVVDEIQNVVNNKHGKNLISMLTQLINNSGVSICMVGTPECIPFFEQDMKLARRSLGLKYDKLEYNQYFYDLCNILFKYQYTKNNTEIQNYIVEWLYEHSSGIISVVVSLIHDAQEISILNGNENIDIKSLNEAYKNRLSMLHDFIYPSIKTNSQTTKIKIKKENKLNNNNKCNKTNKTITIQKLASISKTNNINIIQLLKENNISVTEVKI